ncbi:hypothetical protein EYF80_018500 [Liparis tanakae]|uniref:Uncharacterized protein n=1 Tax=Liparis tanakae TaxID=230148 RepID=A0A4Z2I080_9TELE|nr:hypothetical protein EYF80_018500 [Liparis tanakae]
MAAEEERVETEYAADAPGNAICGWICKGCMPHTPVWNCLGDKALSTMALWPPALPNSSQQAYRYVQKNWSSGFTACSDLGKPKTLTMNCFFTTLA